MTPVGRLALRQEGNYWNAYYAKADTMRGAILIGCIAMRLIENNEARKNAFMLMMQESVTDMFKEVLGEDLAWPTPPRDAPESERGGHA